MPQINEKTWIIIAVVIALIGSLIYNIICFVNCFLRLHNHQLKKAEKEKTTVYKKYSVFVYAYEDDRGYQ